MIVNCLWLNSQDTMNYNEFTAIYPKYVFILLIFLVIKGTIYNYNLIYDEFSLFWDNKDFPTHDKAISQ